MHPGLIRNYSVGAVICGFYLCLAASAKNLPVNQPPDTSLAYFKFAGNGKDSLKKSPNAELENVKFEQNTMFLNGIYAGGNRAANRAIMTIKNLPYDAFTFSLDFFPLDFNEKGAVLNPKRPPFYHSNIITGGTSYRWLGLDHHNGYLSLTLNNQTLIYRFPKVVLAIGHWHNIICSVNAKDRKIFLMIDGQLLDPINLPADFIFNVVRSDQHTPDANFSFTNNSNGGAFYGYAANLKVLGETMTETGIANFFTANQLERPAYQPVNLSK